MRVHELEIVGAEGLLCSRLMSFRMFGQRCFVFTGTSVGGTKGFAGKMVHALPMRNICAEARFFSWRFVDNDLTFRSGHHLPPPFCPA